MALITQTIEVPLAVGHPFPANETGTHIPEDYMYRGNVYHDDLVTPKATVLYFHGSGSSGPIQGPLVDTLTRAGYRVVAVAMLGTPPSSSNPVRFGYGNVNMPQFTQLFIMTSWWVKSVIETVKNMYDEIIIIGHSMGASATLAYLAGYANGQDVEFKSKFKGALCNGATIGGLGNYSWNDVNRNISCLSGVVSHLDDKVIICYSNNDGFAPPDYSKNLQLCINPESEIYFLSPGNLGHSWMNTNAVNAELVKDWVDQLYKETPILNVDGTQAIRGPVG